MGYDFKLTEYDLLAGVDTVHNPADIAQMPGEEGWKGVLHLVTADNMFSPNTRYDLMTRPGFADVRATAINAAGIVTGMFHQGDFGDRFFLAVSIVAGSHNLYLDSTNPPGAIAGGTNPTIGQDNLASFINFTDGANRGTIVMFRLRDTPQFIDTSGTRTDFTITSTLRPYAAEVFGQRALYIRPSVGGTVFLQRVYWSDIRDGNLLTDVTTQFESFETEQGGSINAIKKFSDICLLGLTNNVFLLALTPAARKPFALRELPAGRYKGPISHHGVIDVDQKLWWISQKNLHSIDLSGRIEDLGDLIQPTIAGLSDSRREFTVAGYDAKNDLVLFSVSNSGDSIHKRIIAINTKTKVIYPNWTISANAMAQRMVSGQQRLILGGYVGKFRNWESGATGNLDDAAAAIDGHITTPRHHMGMPHVRKLFAGITVTFDPQATSENVAVKFRLDDASTLTAFSASPYSVTGTANDLDTTYFPLMKVGTHLQLDFDEATSGHIYRIQKYAIHWKPLTPMVN